MRGCTVAGVSFSDVTAQVDDLVDFLNTAKGEQSIDPLKNAISEAVWRARNIAWGIEQLKNQGGRQG